jgi:hypothetical protein
MRDFEDPLLDPSESTVRIEERPQTGSPGGAIAIFALLALAAGGAAWYLMRRPAEPRLPAPAPAAAPVASAEPAAPAAPAVERAYVLPALEASDALLRELAVRLSAHPEIAKWLVHDELVRRFVATVANLAEGASPASHVRFLTPAASHAVVESSGRTIPAASSYRRYDNATEAFVSLDTAGTAKLYRELQPLLDQAYQELGYPGASFDEAMAAAIARLVAVEIPERAPELVPRAGTAWAYADPALEGLPAAEKHLLRLGPENARRAQAKLRELARALGL